MKDLWNSPLEDEERPIVEDVSVQIRFGEKRIRPFFVIVEAWEHKKSGRGRRLYRQEFTEQERRTISNYYSKLYRWYLRTGVPIEGVAIKVGTYRLLQKASNFFATI